MSEPTVKPNDVLLDCLRWAANRAGHGEAWSSGLGTIAKHFVNASAVPQKEMTLEQIKGRLGLTPERIDLAQAAFNLAQHVGLVKR